MEKFNVKFGFVSGQYESIIVEAENEESVTIRVLNHEKWYRHDGLLINLDNVNYINITQHEENPGAVNVSL